MWRILISHEREHIRQITTVDDSNFICDLKNLIGDTCTIWFRYVSRDSIILDSANCFCEVAVSSN